jgi:hypothetical protein
MRGGEGKEGKGERVDPKILQGNLSRSPEKRGKERRERRERRGEKIYLKIASLITFWYHL